MPADLPKELLKTVAQFVDPCNPDNFSSYPFFGSSIYRELRLKHPNWQAIPGETYELQRRLCIELRALFALGEKLGLMKRVADFDPWEGPIEAEVLFTPGNRLAPFSHFLPDPKEGKKRELFLFFDASGLPYVKRRHQLSFIDRFRLYRGASLEKGLSLLRFYKALFTSLAEKTPETLQSYRNQWWFIQRLEDAQISLIGVLYAHKQALSTLFSEKRASFLFEKVFSPSSLSHYLFNTKKGLARDRLPRLGGTSLYSTRQIVPVDILGKCGYKLGDTFSFDGTVQLLLRTQENDIVGTVSIVRRFVDLEKRLCYTENESPETLDDSPFLTPRNALLQFTIGKADAKEWDTRISPSWYPMIFATLLRAALEICLHEKNIPGIEAYCEGDSFTPTTRFEVVATFLSREMQQSDPCLEPATAAMGLVITPLDGGEPKEDVEAILALRKGKRSNFFSPETFFQEETFADYQGNCRFLEKVIGEEGKPLYGYTKGGAFHEARSLGLTPADRLIIKTYRELWENQNERWLDPARAALPRYISRNLTTRDERGLLHDSSQTSP